MTRGNQPPGPELALTARPLLEPPITLHLRLRRTRAPHGRLESLSCSTELRLARDRRRHLLREQSSPLAILCVGDLLWPTGAPPERWSDSAAPSVIASSCSMPASLTTAVCHSPLHANPSTQWWIQTPILEGATRKAHTHIGDYKVHAYNRNGLCALGFMDDHYPVRSAFSLLNMVLDEYQKAFGESWRSIQADVSEPWAYLNEALTKYQDPAEADKLLKIQRDLDETKIILHKTIDSVLERGEKLDSLVEKSSDLSAASQMFYKQAKKTNQCCTIL